MKRFCRQNDIHFRGSSSTDKKTLEIRGYSPSSESEHDFGGSDCINVAWVLLGHFAS